MVYGSAYQSRLHIPSFKAWGKWTEAKDTINGSEENKKWSKQALLSYQDNYFHKFPYQPTKIELNKKERISDVSFLTDKWLYGIIDNFVITSIFFDSVLGSFLFYCVHICLTKFIHLMLLYFLFFVNILLSKTDRLYIFVYFFC